MSKEGRLNVVKYAPPPLDLPILGHVDPKGISFIGKTNYSTALDSRLYVFGLKRVDRRRHVYIIGKSGVGKSKAIELLARQDITFGHGLCVIDPHGDTLESLIDYVPESRLKDVVLIDPSDLDHPVSFNPLANVDPGLKHQFTQNLIEVMEKQFGANWTPRLEHVFRFTCLALLDYPNATMRGMVSMLTDRNYRQNVIKYIEDDMVKRFWAIEFADWSEKFDTDAIIPLVNKLGQFLSNPMMRSIFGQKDNKIDLEKLIREKKIILVNLSKGRLGEENSSFFGAMFITKLKQAGMARAYIPEKQRDDFYVYVDEFHNVVTSTFENLLSESRKYGLCMTIAHQYVGQLLPAVQQAVMGNVGSIVVFRLGGEDAQKMEPEMAPVFKVKDMINLGMREFYIKMIIDGETYDPFSAETLKLTPPPHASLKEKIWENSRKLYSIGAYVAKKLIDDEESQIYRSASDKAAIAGQSEDSVKEPEPLI